MEVRVEGEIWYWRGPSPYHFVTVPDEESAAIKAVGSAVSYGWGVIPVVAQLGDTVWETSLIPKDGRYALPIKDAVRRVEELDDGDTVAVRLVLCAPGQRSRTPSLQRRRGVEAPRQ
jgi:hypothetical protein